MIDKGSRESFSVFKNKTHCILLLRGVRFGVMLHVKVRKGELYERP